VFRSLGCAVVLASLITSCTLTTALDGLSSGAPAGPIADADGSSRDAQADGVLADGGNAAPDGRSAQKDASEPFCATRASWTFCEDFDEPKRAPLEKLLAGAGAADVDASEAASPPNALRIELGPAAVDGEVKAYQTQVVAVAATPSRIVFEWAVRVESIGSPSVSIASIMVAHDSELYELIASVGTSDRLIQQRFTPSPAYLAEVVPEERRIPPGAWSRMRLEVERAGESWTATLSRDGQPSVANVPLTAWTPTSVGTVRFSFGGLYAAASPTSTVLRFDDVSAQIEP
jgi:hypothetical protein